MRPAKVLLVEDDANLRDALSCTLSLAGYEWLEAESGEQALLLLKKNSVDIVVSDVQMAGMNGLNLLRSIRQHFPQLPVLLITAYANIEDAVLAMKEGAKDYLAKPFAPEVLVSMVSRYLPAVVGNTKTIANDAKSKQLLSLAQKVAKTQATVLILGASGSGKEVLAKYIHQQSLRSSKPFVAINCAAIPENMLEATLFGYEKGAFTGAIQSSPGKFEQAQEGTILLDEISEMDLALQAKLLRVLQEREVERLGSRKSIQLNVRVLATSNRDLGQYVAEGCFREDLYYRLNVFPLHWPALCDRKDDIVTLAEHFLQLHSSKLGLEVPMLTEQAQQKLLSYHWPGNVRELDNVMQRALILCQRQQITPDTILLESTDWQQLGGFVTFANSDAQADSLGKELKAQEFSIILDALEACQGKRKEVAQRLGISSRTLRYKLAKMREAGISIP